MAIFPELIEMFMRAFAVVAQEVNAQSDQGAKGNEKEKVPPHTDTSRGYGAHRMTGDLEETGSNGVHR